MFCLERKNVDGDQDPASVINARTGIGQQGEGRCAVRHHILFTSTVVHKRIVTKAAVGLYTKVYRNQ